jgi:hypothetical protein
MRYPVLILILSAVLFINNVYAIPPFNSQEIYDFSNTILTGKVISVNSTFSPTHNLYEIKAEKFLKNPQDSDVIFAAGQKTVNTRLGNTVFNANDRGLFFLMNYTVGHDNPSKIFGIYPTSRLIDIEWDKCDIFEKEIPPEHWVFGGTGPMPKIRQGNNVDAEHFTTGKEIFITYDVFNHSTNPKNATYGIQVKNLDDPNSLYEFTEVNNSHLLEPCTQYKTMTWNFTPLKPGHYMLEFYDLKGSQIGVGFVVLDSAEQTTLNEENSDTVITSTIDLQKLEASRAKCTVLGLSGIESCSIQSSLTLGITTAAIIGTVITVSMLTLRKRK